MGNPGDFDDGYCDCGDILSERDIDFECNTCGALYSYSGERLVAEAFPRGLGDSGVTLGDENNLAGDVDAEIFRACQGNGGIVAEVICG